MSTPRFPPNPFTDLVPRRGATSSLAGLDTYRRLAALEQSVAANTSVDTDSLNLVRAMGSSVRAWAFDPGYCTTASTNTAIVATGILYAVAVYLPSPATVTGVLTHTATAGVGTWTIGKAAIFDSSGTRLAVSNNSTTIWKSTGLNQIAMSSTIDLDRGVYYCAFLNVRSATTTAPELSSRNGYAALQNLLTDADVPRAAAITGQSDMPTSITLSALTPSTATRWTGLY
jgi:hypothetical protein